MSSPVRIGIIGGGKISELHANGYLSSDNAIISAVADKNEKVSKKLQHFKKNWTNLLQEKYNFLDLRAPASRWESFVQGEMP